MDLFPKTVNLHGCMGEGEEGKGKVEREVKKEERQ